MGSEKEIRPFTFKLSYILLTIILLYIVSNVAFISYCSPYFYLSTENGICRISHSFRPIGAEIPVIARPVEFLKQSKQANRAHVVEYDYLFSWVSAIIACLVMSLITLVAILTVSADDRLQLRIHLDRVRRRFNGGVDAKVRGAVALLLILSGYLFFGAYVGDFDFTGYRSLANMVYVRDLDLYRISVDWSFLLLFGMFFLVWGAKAVALRNSTALPPAR